MEPSSVPVSLADLLAACAGGSEGAFEDIYHRTSAKLYSVTLHILKRRDWAEEVVQDAFVRIWRHAAAYSPERGAAMTWMISIARHAALDRLRRQRREVAFSEPEEDGVIVEPSADLMDEVLRNDSARHIYNCLNDLSDPQRRAVLLSYCLGYTHEELAKMNGVPLGTVKSWIRHGLTRLRMCLDS